MREQQDMELLHEVTKDDRNVSPNNSALLEKERELQKKKKELGQLRKLVNELQRALCSKIFVLGKRLSFFPSICVL